MAWPNMAQHGENVGSFFMHFPQNRCCALLSSQIQHKIYNKVSASLAGKYKVVCITYFIFKPKSSMYDNYNIY